MSVWTPRKVRVIVTIGALFAAASVARVLPVRAEPEGVLGQHLALLDRNAASFAAKDREALANDLTEDYVRKDLLGGRTTRNQEVEALQQLFAKASHLQESSQASRLIVQGGDATHPTVAITLVQTTRSADMAGPDGQPHAMTWEIVDTEERISTPGGWKCRQRVELKRRVLRDGAPLLPDETPAAALAREQIRRSYDDLARASNAGDKDSVRRTLSPAFEARAVGGGTLAAGPWIAEVERRRKEAWKSDGSYTITGLALENNRATVGCQHVLLRQAPDKEGVIHTVRETTSSRDTWEKTPQGWTLLRSEALLGERDFVQPLEATGW